MRPSWETELDLPDGRVVETYPGIAAEVTRPSFVWQISGRSDIEPFSLERCIDGGPARVLVHVPPASQPHGPGEWLYDPDRQELDVAGEVVRAWVDGLPKDLLVAMARDLADRATSFQRTLFSDAEQALAMADAQLDRMLLTEAALSLDDEVARMIALGWVPDWRGTAEELIEAARAAAMPPSQD